MLAKWILGVLAALFLLLAAVRIMRDGGRIVNAGRTWLIVGVVFAVVACWLVGTA